MRKTTIYWPGGAQIHKEWDDATTTFTRYDKSGNLLESRTYNPGEIAAAARRAGEDAADGVGSSLDSKLTTGLVANIAYLDAPGVPGIAQLRSQVEALTRQVDALIKIKFDLLTDQDGT